MRAGALPDATKIDAKRNESCIIQSRGCAKNYFVVHRSAAERMRMQHQCDAACGLNARWFQNRFQLSVRSRNEQIACGIHEWFDFGMAICDCLVERNSLSLLGEVEVKNVEYFLSLFAAKPSH